MVVAWSLKLHQMENQQRTLGERILGFKLFNQTNKIWSTNAVCEEEKP